MTHLIFLFRIIFTWICDIEMCLLVNINLLKMLELASMRIITTAHIMIHNMIKMKINEELTITAIVSNRELFTLVQNIYKQ